MVFILFLISPLLALMLSFKNIKSKEFMYSLLLMAAFMGLVLNVNSGADLSYYLSTPKIWKNRDWSLIFNEKDYLFPIISKLFSYITTNENCFGAFIFVIFASLYYQSFKILTEQVLNQQTLWYYLCGG